MESLEHNLENLPRNACFWQVGLFDVILVEYPDESHNFTNITFMSSTLF